MTGNKAPQMLRRQTGTEIIAATFGQTDDEINRFTFVKIFNGIGAQRRGAIETKTKHGSNDKTHKPSEIITHLSHARCFDSEGDIIAYHPQAPFCARLERAWQSERCSFINTGCLE
jgi:hypothetical protein